MLRNQVVGIAAVAAVSLCAGCGQSDEDQVRATVKQFYGALSNHNSRQACDLMTEHVRNSFSVNGVSTCVDLIDRAGDQSGWSGPPTISNIAVDGDRASVSLTQGIKTGRATLRKQNGEWRLQDF